MISSIRPLVVLDTNVFISGLLWGGNPKKVIEQWLEEEYTFAISPYLAHEILTTYMRFENSPENIEKLTLYLTTKTRRVLPKRKVTVCRDPKDNQILDLCLASGADYLITGDKDLLTLKHYKQTIIVTPAQFLKSAL